jgi:hypothetical protein
MLMLVVLNTSSSTGCSKSLLVRNPGDELLARHHVGVRRGHGPIGAREVLLRGGIEERCDRLHVGLSLRMDGGLEPLDALIPLLILAHLAAGEGGEARPRELMGSRRYHRHAHGRASTMLYD